MGINISKLKEKFDKKSVERSDRFVFKDDDNYLRILPPSIEYLGESVDYISFDYLMHYNLGIEGEKISEVCPKTCGKHHKCPVCEVVYKLYKTNTAEDQALAGKMRGKIRHIFNIIDLNTLDKGIQIMETGPKVYEEIIKFITNPKWGDLLDLDKGRNFTITKTSDKKTTSGYIEYSVAPDPDSSSIRNQLPQNYKEMIGFLKKNVPSAKSYDALKMILEGDSNDVTTSEKQEHKTESVREDKPTEVKEEHKKPVEVKKEPPNCFSIDYGPKRDICLECSYKIDCRKKFLEID